MHRVSIDKLEPSRTCFTDIKSSSISFEPDEATTRDIERKLKILLMTKGHVVIPADILLCGFQLFDFLNDAPHLINSGTIIAAIPASATSFDDFAHNPDPLKPNEVSLAKSPHTPIARGCIFLDTSATSVIAYDPLEAGRWMQRMLYYQFTAPNTLLKALFPTINETSLRELAALVYDQPYLSRFTAHNLLSSPFSDAMNAAGVRRDIRALEHFLYDLDYIAMSRAVDCTGILPQENCSVAKAFGPERASYSEIWFFWQLLIQIYSDLAGTRFTVEALDLLTFEDIISIRSRVMSTAFRQNYNRLLHLAKAEVYTLDPEGLVLTLNEVEDLIHQLEETFMSELTAELKSQRRQHALYDAAKGFYSLATVLIPPLGLADGVGKPFAHFFRAILGRSRTEEMKHVVEPKLIKARRISQELYPFFKGDDTILIDFVNDLQRRSWDHAVGQLSRFTSINGVSAPDL